MVANMPCVRPKTMCARSWLKAQGFEVLRYWNHDVFGDIEPLLEAIWFALRAAAKAREARHGGPRERGRRFE